MSQETSRREFLRPRRHWACGVLGQRVARACVGRDSASSRAPCAEPSPRAAPESGRARFAPVFSGYGRLCCNMKADNLAGNARVPNSNAERLAGKPRNHVPWLFLAGLLFLGLSSYVAGGGNPAEDTKSVISAFHSLYYRSQSQTWGNTYWLGTPVMKATSDLWIFQEIIYQTKPDVIIEAGTYKGGSAYFMASICELINHGRVITIDIVQDGNKPQHKRIKYLLGSSTSPKIVGEIKKLIQPN